MCAKFKIYRLRHFLSGTCQVFITQKPLPSKIPLTIKTATHFLIKLPSVRFLLKSIHPLHEINHSSARKKVNIWIRVGYFPFLISFFCENEINKKSSIRQDTRFIHTFLIRISFIKIYCVEIFEKCKNIAQAQFFASWKHFVAVFVHFHSYIKYSCCRILFQLVQQ